MNAIETQPISTVTSPLPDTEFPQISTDPNNPLAWILLITLLLSNTDEVINAVANLIRAVAALKRRNRKRSNRKRCNRDT